MRIEAVSHGSDHDPGDEDHHSKGDDAAVAGEFGTPRGGHQLNLTDQGDSGDHNFTLRAFLHYHGRGRLWGSQVVFYGLFSHFSGDVSYLASQTRLGKPGQGRSSRKGSPLPGKPLDLVEENQPEYLPSASGKEPVTHWALVKGQVRDCPWGTEKTKILNCGLGFECWSSPFMPPLLLNDACLSLPLSFYSLRLWFAPPCHFFSSFFSLPADSEFWLVPTLLSDMVIRDHHFRVPRDRSQHGLLFLSRVY